ncbi:MAG: putative repeat protein (TIGR03806 family) [Saprospiraceae bacterium]|jgi:uncharacterized repeat protein (TIGR03806 family)
MKHTKYLFLAMIIVSACVQSVETVSAKKAIDGLHPLKETIETHGLGKGKLSEYGFFNHPIKEFKPAHKNVIPYEINSSLFSDYASKKRFIVCPQGAKIKYDAREVFDFPIGTTLVKNFYYKATDLEKTDSSIIMETRILIKEKDSSWTALPYVWNEEQTDAYLSILGKTLEVARNTISGTQSFSYAVPNLNQCKSCHMKGNKPQPIGPTARQLNRDNIIGKTTGNQLDYLIQQNFLTGLESAQDAERLANYEDAGSGSINERARAYLDINCAHCHRVDGSARNTALYLDYDEMDEIDFGINKHPISAGQGSGNLKVDIVKGSPEESILAFRMKHTDPNIMMPEMGKKLIHKEGVALIEQWIREME